ncbi:MAG: hypothetical protein ACP8RL_04220 [cyanobacterium endosymbiont of Rhopalodia inflata]
MIYLSETSHGFGHEVCLFSLTAAIQTLNLSILLILVTTNPRWLLESYIAKDFI